jgi:hypothetical protein
MATGVLRKRKVKPASPRVVPYLPPPLLSVQAVYRLNGRTGDVDLHLAPWDVPDVAVAVITVGRADWPGHDWPPRVGVLVRVIPARVELAEVGNG